MGLDKLAKEYRQSAEQIGERIALLKRINCKGDSKANLLVEDRLLVLSAEYGYLLRMADYFENYYNEGRVNEEIKL